MKHLKESNLNYVEHLICAWYFAALHLMVVPVALFHGLFPFVLGGLGKRLNSKIKDRYWNLVHYFQDRHELEKTQGRFGEGSNRRVQAERQLDAAED